MASTPSCYLYLSFLLHFAGFSALLAGYSTPYWTMVKKSTGDVFALGLVVSCFKRSCEMLHVTETRLMFVIVFGMCTVTILLSLFIVQAFCLALYNASCKTKNIGTGFSYLSFFLALSLGATLALYQLDLAEEDKPDVTSMKIGWSRFSVMGSSGAFFLGALLNIADYTRRNRLHRQKLQKKEEVRNKMIAMLEKNRQGQPARSRPAAGTSGQSSGGDFKGKRLSMTVDAAVNLAQAQKGLQKTLDSCRKPKQNSNVILVNEASSRTDSSDARGAGQQQQQRLRSQLRDGGGGTTAAAEALKRYKLTKTAHVESVDGRQALPSVEEESEGSSTGRDRRRGETRELARQLTKTRVAEPASRPEPSSDMPRRTSVLDKGGRTSKRSPKLETETSDSSSKYVITAESQEIKSPNISTRNEKAAKEEENSKTQTMQKPSDGQRKRRGSAVEDALISVSHFLGDTTKLGLPSDTSVTSQKYSLDRTDSTKSRHEKSISSTQNSFDRSSEKSTELPPVSHRRRLVTEESEEILRNGLKQQRTIDSEKDSLRCFSKDESSRSKLSGDSFDKEKDKLQRSDTKSSSEKEKASPRESKFPEQLSEEQIKRNQIVENMTRNKEKKKKRITQ